MNVRSSATLFAAALVATNWSWSRTIQRPNISESVTITGAGIASIFCAIAIVILSIRLFRLVREFLDQRVRVPLGVKLFSWHPCLCLVLLLFHVTYSSSISVGDTLTKMTRGYGSDSSSLLLVLGALLIILFQIYDALRIYRQEPDFPTGVPHGFSIPA